jgi:ferrous iron transport protein A
MMIKPLTRNDKHLSEITTGKEVTLTGVQVGRELTSRLTSLGLTPGVVVQVLQNHGRGPIIINVRGTHVALGRGEAEKLMVEPCGDA